MLDGRYGGVDWQMKIDHARCKLKTVYPKVVLWQSTRFDQRKTDLPPIQRP